MKLFILFLLLFVSPVFAGGHVYVKAKNFEQGIIGPTNGGGNWRSASYFSTVDTGGNGLSQNYVTWNFPHSPTGQPSTITGQFWWPDDNTGTTFTPIVHWFRLGANSNSGARFTLGIDLQADTIGTNYDAISIMNPYVSSDQTVSVIDSFTNGFTNDSSNETSFSSLSVFDPQTGSYCTGSTCRNKLVSFTLVRLNDNSSCSNFATPWVSCTGVGTGSNPLFTNDAQGTMAIQGIDFVFP